MGATFAIVNQFQIHSQQLQF